MHVRGPANGALVHVRAPADDAQHATRALVHVRAPCDDALVHVCAPAHDAQHATNANRQRRGNSQEVNQRKADDPCPARCSKSMTDAEGLC